MSVRPADKCDILGLCKNNRSFHQFLRSTLHFCLSLGHWLLKAVFFCLEQKLSRRILDIRLFIYYT